MTWIILQWTCQLDIPLNIVDSAYFLYFLQEHLQSNHQSFTFLNYLLVVLLGCVVQV